MLDSPTSTGSVSLATSHTQVFVEDDADHHSPKLADIKGVPAISDDEVEDKMEVKDDDDLEYGPLNPRNWSPAKKWTATTLVS